MTERELLIPRGMFNYVLVDIIFIAARSARTCQAEYDTDVTARRPRDALPGGTNCPASYDWHRSTDHGVDTPAVDAFWRTLADTDTMYPNTTYDRFVVIPDND